MPTHLSPLFALSLATTAHAGLRVDPAAPPLHAGRERYVFGEAVLEVLPAVVLHLSGGAAAPTGARALGGRSWLLPVPDADAAVATALRLDALPGVTAFPDVLAPRGRAGVEFDDPSHGGQWYLETLEMDLLYERSLGDPNSRVAVLDSGIDISHPDLAEAIDLPYDAFGDDDDPSPNPGEYCPGGSDGICDDHGTAVSGVVAARANNGEGIVGLCPECTLIPVKLLGDSQASSLSENIRAFEHAIAADVGVINNSWGFTTSIAVPEPLAEVIARAHEEPRGGLGALVVFAAGNDNREIDDDEMQAMPEVLCVTATDAYGRYTNYTNSGSSVDVSAPSATVTLSAGGGTTTTFGGTSAAAPVISGLAGWALSIRPDLSAAELQELIIATAVPSPLVTHDEAGHHPVYGYGEVHPAALWEALEPTGGDDRDEGIPAGENSKRGCAVIAGSPTLVLGGLATLGLLLRRRRIPEWTIGAHRVKVSAPGARARLREAPAC